MSSELFEELKSVHLLAFSARVCSLAFLSSGSPFLAICRAVFIHLVLFCVCSYSFLSLVIVLISAVLGLIFLILIRDFSCLLPCFLFPVLFFLAGLHCLLRMSCF